MCAVLVAVRGGLLYLFAAGNGIEPVYTGPRAAVRAKNSGSVGAHGQIRRVRWSDDFAVLVRHARRPKRPARARAGGPRQRVTRRGRDPRT